MQLSCAVPVNKASEGFAKKIAELGLKPIVTSVCIRTVYEGNDRRTVDAVLALYENEPDHEIVYDGDRKKKNKKRHH